MKEIKFNTIIEPFRIKMTEELPLLSLAERQVAIKKAFYNLFSLKAREVTFDFLTDSGTSAMSSQQWAGMITGDESYAGSKSFERFERAIQDLTGLEFVVPTHQGRSAEYLLMTALSRYAKNLPSSSGSNSPARSNLGADFISSPSKHSPVVIGNTHFDTTRANIENVGAVALDMPSKETHDTNKEAPFKGNIDIDQLKAYLKENSGNVLLVILTITNNSVGGQPVSMKNIKETREVLKPYGIPLFIDAARFSENSYFIKKREPEYKDFSIRSIAKEIFSYADGVLMSAKKDAFGNIGGFLAVQSQELAKILRNLMVITEGFPTYGGLAGRDLEALAIGLEEILDENYLTYRIRSVAYFGEGIEKCGILTVKPYGGHAVYLDAAKTLPHIPVSEYPGQSLSVALYESLGVRSVEVGSVMLGRKDTASGREIPAPQELVRLALPRRVYTQSHIDYILEGMEKLSAEFSTLKGFSFEEEAPVLRHFTSKFKPL